MKPVFWLRKSAGAIFVFMCGVGIAYAMDHSGTPLVHIRASLERTVVPNEVSLRVSTDSVLEVDTITCDYEGDGRFEAEGHYLYSQTVTFSHAGHFSPWVSGTNKQGRTFKASAEVVVENLEHLEAALNARWRGMLAALAKKDIEGAVSFVLTRKRDAMRHDWTVLADHLGQIGNLFSVPLQLTDGQGFRGGQIGGPIALGEKPISLGGRVCVGSGSSMVYQTFLKYQNS
ncbi:MAG: hypothetical protein NPIRA06_17770 [Nitrospirales bacterium]|nr:MAG: hypothetical protein NPIRA06_17770 [Nitrospirales bacterium]